MEQVVQQPQIALPDVPQVGDIISEKYRVEGILGVGGMGVILAARHLQLGQTVAIKVLSIANHDRRQDSIERFLREGRAAAALSSDHVVRIYDVGQLPTGIPFMVMEQLRGHDLATRLAQQGPLPIADAVEYVAQATMAITEAHEVGIVHRDLKPGNLFLTQRSDGTPCVKVLDFGISKQLSEFDNDTLRGALTSTRQVMGSPAYMSPEQVRDAKSVDHRTDIWSLGLTLYELLTRHVAFDADTLPAVCAAIAADPPVPVRTRRSDVPEALERIVLKCLEKAPDRRYPSARALLAALRSFQGKSAEVESGSDGHVPVTETSAMLQQALTSGARSQNNLIESGPRSVDSLPREPSDDTLISGRTPARSDDGQPVFPAKNAAAATAGEATGAEPSGGTAGVANDVARAASLSAPRADSSWRRPIGLGLVGLVFIGAATAWILLGRGAADPARQASKSALESNGTRTHFMLRITSEPVAASVIEAGNRLGVTPLYIDVDRSAVQATARQFVLQKEGYASATFQQGDSLTDVQQNVTLQPIPIAAASATPPAATATREPVLRPTVQPATHKKIPAATPSAAADPATDIRISR